MAAAHTFLSTFKKHEYSVNTKVSIDGESIGEGNQLNDATDKCVTNRDDRFSEVEVCGCEVKVVASLMTRCEEYHQYTTEVGSCDCGQSGCVTKKLTHGRNDNEMKAMSYKVVSCN